MPETVGAQLMSILQALVQACGVGFYSFPNPRNTKAALLGHLTEALGSSASLLKVHCQVLHYAGTQGGVGVWGSAYREVLPMKFPIHGVWSGLLMSEITHWVASLSTPGRLRQTGIWGPVLHGKFLFSCSYFGAQMIINCL